MRSRIAEINQRKKFSAKSIEFKNVADLLEHPQNPKQHPAEQIKALSLAILELGFDQPIVVDETNTILKGHGRVEAATLAGLTQVPSIVRSGLTDDEKLALVISDNQLPQLGTWDQKLLREGLTSLAKANFDTKLLGFSDVRLATFGIGSNTDTDPDEEEEPKKVAVSRAGDVWLLGDHRIICGDSTDAATVDKLLADDKPHLMVTDPPYGVDYDANWRNERVRSNGSPIAGRAIGAVENDGVADWRKAYDLFPGEVAYAWSAGLRSREAIEGLEAAGFEIRAQIIWVKQQFAIGRGHYHFQHEPCWYAVRKGKTAHWRGDRSQSTRWDIDKPQKSETGHSTQKPVECMARPIRNNSKTGDLVYEPFAGSGTTIIAAEMTGRKCLAIELSLTYVDVCVRRWEKFAAKKAVLQSTKKTFDQVERERAKKKPG